MGLTGGEPPKTKLEDLLWFAGQGLYEWYINRVYREEPKTIRIGPIIFIFYNEDDDDEVGILGW